MSGTNLQKSRSRVPYQGFSILYSPLFPVFSFGLSLLVIGVALFSISEQRTFAAPRVPAGPTTISITATPTVNLGFAAGDLQNSVLKTGTVDYNTQTNNLTGLTVYMASVDEDTNLNHENSTVTDKIPSITTSYSYAQTLPAKTWSYDSLSGQHLPIPKASSPDTLNACTVAGACSGNFKVSVKAAPGLISGLYSKDLVLTAVSNYVPKIAEFLPGPEFNDLVRTGAATNRFQRSATAPANLATAKVVSKADSDYPIYVWHEVASQTTYWWSEADTAYANEDSSEMFMDLGNNGRDVQLVDVRGINTSRVKNMYMMFNGSKFAIKTINFEGMDTSNVENMSFMFAAGGGGNLISDPIDISRLNTSKVKDMMDMFRGSRATAINLTGIDTSQVVNMSGMFSGAGRITTLDLSGFNTNNVIGVFDMFSGMEELTSLNLSGWQNSKITSMKGMFNGLKKLTSLNLTNFRTSNVTNMEYMFDSTEQLLSLNLASFDTSKVTNMKGMFSRTFVLSDLNISSFNTSGVTDMSEMFAESRKLTTLNLSHFNTGNVTTMRSMFQGMAKLANLNLNSFDTRRVTDMRNMFYWSMMEPENGTLDVSSFNTLNVTQASGMFFYTKVKTIYASPSFVTTAMPPTEDLFTSNSNLTGGNGTAYAWPNNGKEFARIDAPGSPGYFTQKP